MGEITKDCHYCVYAMCEDDKSKVDYGFADCICVWYRYGIMFCQGTCST